MPRGVTRAMRLAGLGIAAAAGLALVLVVSCSPKKVLGPDVAPQTTVFVQFDPNDATPHTVNHVVRLFWNGQDPDGYVVAYEFRFLEPGGPADPPWSRTTVTDSLFTFQVPTGSASPTFEVRAIDDQGQVDPTPASQTLSLSNQAPTVAIVSPPRTTDSTYAALTLTLQAADIDGNPDLLQFRVWLDGNQGNARLVSGRSVSLVPDDFKQGGKLRAGPRTVTIEPIDDGGRVGTAATATWFVRAPVPDTLQRARLLIIDNISLGQNTVQNRNYDALFVNLARAKLPAGSFEILRLEFTQPFRSATDVENTFKLYDAVAWYRGTARASSSTTAFLLSDYWSGIDAYLEAGGKFFIEGLDLTEGLGNNGMIPEAAVSSRFGVSKQYARLNPTPPPDSIADWGVDPGYQDTQGGTTITHLSVLRSTVFADSLKVTQILTGGIRAFAVRDTQDVAIWARDSVLATRPTFDAAVGVTVPQPLGGRLVALSIPLFSIDGFSSISRFLGKVFDQLGLNGPGPLAERVPTFSRGPARGRRPTPQISVPQGGRAASKRVFRLGEAHSRLLGLRQIR